MLRVTSSSATKSPKFLLTLRISIPIGVLLRSEHGDDDERRHRDRGEQEAGRIRRPLLEVLVLLLDDEGRRLGLLGDVAGDDLDRAELTRRPGQAEHDAVHEGPADRRQRDAQERLPRPGAETLSSLLLVGADLVEYGHELADDERE